jgi:hypothetical protein
MPPTPRYSPPVYVIRLTEERQTVFYVCIRTRSGEVHAGGCFACTAAKRVLQRFNGGRKPKVRHDDLTSYLFWSDARVDAVACCVGITASRGSAR